MSDLKKQLIKLGSTNPELRPHIRPLLDGVCHKSASSNSKLLTQLKKKSKIEAKAMVKAFPNYWHPLDGKFKWGTPHVGGSKPEKERIRFNGKYIEGTKFLVVITVPYTFEGPFQYFEDMVNTRFRDDVVPSFRGKMAELVNGYRVHPFVFAIAGRNDVKFYFQWEVPPDSTEIRKHIEHIERDLERLEDDLGSSYRNHPEYKKTIDELKEWRSKLAKEY